MSISLDEVRHVAKLARLELDDSELRSFQDELNALIGHFADIQQVGLEGLDAHVQALALQNVWSEDDPTASLSRESALKNAPVSKRGLFIVPQIIEG